MSNPKKHHYLPRFYLKRWCAPDGRVSEFRRFGNKLHHSRRHPSETGFETELYSIESHADPRKRQAVETRLMSKLDNDAASALDFMEQHNAPPSEERARNGWTRFLLSLLHRSPWRMAKMRATLDQHQDELLADIARRYNDVREPQDPATFTEYMAADNRAVVHESMAVLLSELMNSSLVGQALISMKWGWVQLNRPKYGLLTSDMPLMISNGIGHRNGFLILPVAPDAFFIASHRTEIIDAFTSQRGQDLERGLNDGVVQQGRKLVIGRDRQQQRFIDSRFLRSDGPEGEWTVHTWQHPLVDLREGVASASRLPATEIRRQARQLQLERRKG